MAQATRPAPHHLAVRSAATADGAALAFPCSEAYNFGAVDGGSNVSFCKRLRSRIRGGDALSRRARGPRAGGSLELLDPELADGFQRRCGRGRERLRQFSELRLPRP